MKELFLLLGYPKSGSSAVQVFLRRNEEALRAHGVGYPLLDARELTAIEQRGFGSGNGVFIVEALKRGLKHQPLFDRIAATPEDKVVLATESFGQLNRAQAAPLRNWLKGLGVPVRLIAFHRDPFELALSGYAQAVKGGRLAVPLERACGVFQDPQQRIRNVFQPEFAIEEHDFRSHRADIVGATLRLISPAIALPTAGDRPTNRSFTREELALVRHLNGSDLGQKALEEVINAILRADPLGTPLRHSRRSVAVLCRTIGLAEAEHADKIGADEPEDAAALLELSRRIHNILVRHIPEKRPPGTARPAQRNGGGRPHQPPPKGPGEKP